MLQRATRDTFRAQDSYQGLSHGSRLFSELLDPNHDAWRVFRDGERWTFYREVGGSGAGLPLGSVVLTTEPGKKQTLDFISAKGRRSLVGSYGDELAEAAQLLVDRERVISLYMKLAYYLDTPSWDHSLSFSKAEVIERRVALRAGSAAYERLVGDFKGRAVASPDGGFKGLRMAGPPGLTVSEHEGAVPFVECAITYPRPLALRFFSNRLRDGLHAITYRMVSLVLAHNRSVEDRCSESGWDEL